MTIANIELGLGIKADGVTPTSRSYRPPSWPPPSDWVISEDREQNEVSRYGDDIWDFTPWAGKTFRLDIVGGVESKRAKPVDHTNAEILRLLTAWLIWGPRPVRRPNTLKSVFSMVRMVIAHCSQHGIRATDISHTPKVLEQLPAAIVAATFARTVALMHGFWEDRDAIGLVLLDQAAIKRLAENSPRHEAIQTAYIPPRIWAYQVERLRECLDDFAKHQSQLESCFNFCVDAYAKNFGSLTALYSRNGKKLNHSILPFHDEPGLKNPGIRSGRQFYGPFEGIAKQFGIKDLLERWLPVPAQGWSVKQISTYLSLVQYSGLAYIITFTLQRLDEAMSLRADCLYWEHDEKLGRVPIVRGETTKTDQDSDARWPTSPTVQSAIDAMVCICRLRMRCAASDPRSRPSREDQENPRLVDRSFDPWSGRSDAASLPYHVRPRGHRYQVFLNRWPRLFDPEKLRITEEDLMIAKMLTPNLSEERGFAVGEVWPLSWHQLRRTSAVNMFASGILSDSSMQVLMKHSSRLMPLYYGRGHTKLHLNEEVRTMVVSAMYETMAHGLLSITTDRYVSPHGNDRKEAIIVNLIGKKDAKTLAAAGRKGETTFREIRLGACTKLGNCEYGGIESVARCGGGDRLGACSDVLFDRTKVESVERQLVQFREATDQAPVGSPRQRALQAETTAMENYLNVIKS